MTEIARQIRPDTEIYAAVAIYHGLGAIPTWWEISLVCRAKNVGFKRGDEVKLIPEAVTSVFIAYAGSHCCTVHFASGPTIRIRSGEPIDNSKWRLRLRVMK